MPGLCLSRLLPVGCYQFIPFVGTCGSPGVGCGDVGGLGMGFGGGGGFVGRGVGGFSGFVSGVGAGGSIDKRIPVINRNDRLF
jgi:hypothetical protein